MKKKFFILMMIFTALILSSCDLLESEESASAAGKLSKLDGSPWMYGTHIISDNESYAKYALKSSKINLDNYDGKTVIVFGTKVKGYPVDSGPDYMEVTRVQEAN